MLPTKYNLEDILRKFMSILDARMNSLEASQRNQEASIHNLEKQIGQVVKLVSRSSPRTLLSNTEVMLRAHVNAFTVRHNGEVPNNETMVVIQEKSTKKEE